MGTNRIFSGKISSLIPQIRRQKKWEKNAYFNRGGWLFTPFVMSEWKRGEKKRKLSGNMRFYLLSLASKFEGPSHFGNYTGLAASYLGGQKNGTKMRILMWGIGFSSPLFCRSGKGAEKTENSLEISIFIPFF